MLRPRAGVDAPPCRDAEPTTAPAFTLGLYPWYSAAWLGYYEPPRVYQYDVYISETSLYDVHTQPARVEWHGPDEGAW